jgi:hypothetical protein
MKVKDVIAQLSKVDQELEVTTCIDEACFGEFSWTYGIEPTFIVEDLYEYGERIYTDIEDVYSEMADDEVFDETEVRSETKLVIMVAP